MSGERKNQGKAPVYMVYALRHPLEPYVYIGKTRGRRLSSAYSEHICQRVAATSGYFDRDTERPLLYLLETLEAPRSIVYKHVLCWVKIFEDGGYCALNHDRTVLDANFPFEDTGQILEQLRQEPLDRVLQRTFLEKPTDGDRPPDSERPALPGVQINLRIHPEDKKQFTDWCSAHGLTQREGFSLLLDRREEEASQTHALELIKTLRKENQQLIQENGKMKQRISRMNGESLPEGVRQKVELIPFLQTALPAYCAQTVPVQASAQPLLRRGYRRFMKAVRISGPYRYPEEEGCMVIRLDAVLWGKPIHRACFLVGSDAEGSRWKFRYYPKPTFLGPCPRDSAWATQSSLWYLGYRKAKDGAMELTLALPLPEQSTPLPQNPGTQEEVRKPSLEDRIQLAEHRKEQSLLTESDMYF